MIRTYGENRFFSWSNIRPRYNDTVSPCITSMLSAIDELTKLYKSRMKDNPSDEVADELRSVARGLLQTLVVRGYVKIEVDSAGEFRAQRLKK